ncbi:MAG: hypothetical protein KDD62_04560 [Bdellovibrionales bacterium]|nr:hypothetical protein [Bdellovibrionales bacterium]
MSTAEKIHFCSSLSRDYATIGRELLEYEASSLGPQLAFRNFREGVVFVSIAVLETYLEDLLDSDVLEERLYIGDVKPSSFRQNMTLGLLASFAVCVGLSLFFNLLPVLAGAALLGIGSLVTYYICFISPKGKLVRRMGFAKVVSKEISRRRGIDDQGRRPAKQILEDWFSRASGTGSLVGAAKITIH